jgi:hypothetical protein
MEFGETTKKPGPEYSLLQIISKVNKQVCCGEKLEEDPFIVPPTWNKTVYHEQIRSVWEKAAFSLHDAENIFILGYSLPGTDLFFNYLFALGVDMETILKSFNVYNIDPEAEKRFKDLLGSGIIQRLHFYNTSFEKAVQSTHDIMDEVSNLEYKTIPEILNIQNTGSNIIQVQQHRGW